MTSNRSLPAEVDAHKTDVEACPHCYGGIVYESTEDALVDGPHECHMCFGTAIRMDRAERTRAKAERKVRAR